MSIFMKKSKSANTEKKGSRKLLLVAGILAVMVLGVSGCKSETVETVVPSETVVVESTEDRFAVNEDLDVGYYDDATDSIKTGLSETLSDSERKALTQDLDGELDAPLEAEEEAVMTEADYELFEGIIAQMKVEIDGGVFPKEFMDTLEEDMPEIWLIGCTDEVYIAEKTVEITDYWNAKYDKPAPAETKASTKNNNTQQTKPAETKAPVKETQAPKPTESKAPAQSNSGGTQGEMTPEEKVALDRLKEEASQDIKDSHVNTKGNGPLSEAEKNIGMY